MRATRTMVTPLLLGGALLLAGACGGEGVTPTPPPDGEIRAALLAVLGPGGTPTAQNLRVADRGPDGPVYRPPRAEELPRVVVPDHFSDVRIDGARCRYDPVWKVAFRPVENGRPGAPLVAEVVETPGGLRLLARPWPATRRPDGTLAPDFRPRRREASGEGGGERVLAVVYPPWASPE